jgi:hypothetical protein
MELQQTHISYSVSRKGKRITLIACIAANGSFLRPALVIARKAFDDDLLLFWYTREKMEIYDQQRAYIDREARNTTIKIQHFSSRTTAQNIQEKHSTRFPQKIWSH